jgi:hypothetical protein
MNRKLHWLFVEPWEFWVCVGALVVAVLFVWLCRIDAEPRVRSAGVVLQLLGLITTALGIRKTRMDFGHPGIFTNIANWLARGLTRNRSVSIGSLHANVGLGDIGMAVGSTAAPPGSSIEERVAQLERWIPLLEKRATEIDQRAMQEKNERIERDNAERAAREAADAQIANRLENTATGGLRLTTIGLVWLIVGTVLAGFSIELSGLLRATI